MRRMFRLAGLIVGVLASGWTARADLTIAESGKSPYVIVVPDEAIPSERYAAEELQGYLTRMTGAALPIARRSEVKGECQICLGEGALPVMPAIHVDVAPLGTDGFTIRTEGSRLLVVGGRPRGTLNGVYALLEEKLGVRWFAPDCEVVPKLERVAIGAIDETQVPALQQREVYWSECMQNPDFAARLRLNGFSYGLTEKHGGRAVVYFPFVHSLDALVPPDLYKEHPDYFPLIGGERKNGYVQRCLSNPAVVKMSLDRVRQWIKEHPEANIVSVSQNDTANYCECPACKAIDEAEGTPMGSFLTFVNTIAAAIEKEAPNVRIDTLAYQYTRKPPLKLRPHPNVNIRLCSIECCFAHPLESCPAAENQRFAADITAWQPIAPRLDIWDYTTNFSAYQQPFPNFDALQANVRYFVQHGVKGLFEQGNYSGGGHGEMEPLRAYVLAKCVWNPDTDVARHVAEFLAAYYGPAADPMGRFVELMQAQVRGKDVHAHVFDNRKPGYLNDAFLTEAQALLDEAESKAPEGKERERVKIARLPIQFVLLSTERVKGEERAKMLETFLAVARQAKISNISEGQSLEDWAKGMK